MHGPTRSDRWGNWWGLQTSGATAAVASLRETSIVFGAVIGTVFFGERFGIGRVIAAAAVALGIALVNL